MALPSPPSLSALPTDTLFIAALVAVTYLLLFRLATLLTADADVATANTPPAGPSGLTGRVVWITGASSGIGAALAEAVVAAGGRVVLTARREDMLAAAANRLGGPSVAAVVAADVADAATAASTVAAAVAAYGTVDVLVNNAGVSTRETGAALGAAAVDAVVGVNFTGPVALSRELLAIWAAERAARGGGTAATAAHRHDVRPTLLFVSSVAAVLHVPLRSAYCGAKAAVVAWANVVRLEEPATRVLTVLPGSVRTGLSVVALTATGTYGATDRRLAAGLPPSRVAERIVAVLADEQGGVEEVWLGHKWPELALLYVATYARPVWVAVARRLAGRYQRELQADGAAFRGAAGSG
ncbi:hypothetical protein MMPV_009061 [Pyropia vietnamensis]